MQRKILGVTQNFYLGHTYFKSRVQKNHKKILTYTAENFKSLASEKKFENTAQDEAFGILKLLKTSLQFFFFFLGVDKFIFYKEKKRNSVFKP